MAEDICCAMAAESMYSKDRKLAARERHGKFCAQEICQQDTSRQQ